MTWKNSLLVNLSWSVKLISYIDCWFSWIMVYHRDRKMVLSTALRKSIWTPSWCLSFLLICYILAPLMCHRPSSLYFKSVLDFCLISLKLWDTYIQALGCLCVLLFVFLGLVLVPFLCPVCPSFVPRLCIQCLLCYIMHFVLSVMSPCLSGLSLFLVPQGSTGHLGLCSSDPKHTSRSTSERLKKKNTMEVLKYPVLSWT